MARSKKDMTGIRKRGNSYRVYMFAGYDPITRKRVYLDHSTQDRDEAIEKRDKFRAQIAEQRSAPTKTTFRQAVVEWLKTHEIEQTTRLSYESYLRLYIGPAFGDEPISKITARTLEKLYAHLRRCSRLCDGSPQVDHLDQEIDGQHACRVVKHRRPPGRKPAGGYPPHNCQEKGCRVSECKAHVCKGLSNSTILKIHFMISAVFTAAVRWEWVSSNPAEVAKKPRQPHPRPSPPSATEATRIVEAAYGQDPAWGMLVWLVMVTGMRRAELLALRWRHVDFDRGTLLIGRNFLQRGGRSYEKDTKTHQERGLALDEVTVEALKEHRRRYEEAIQRIGGGPTEEAYLFSYSPSFDRPCNPDAVSHRYIDMCARVGIQTNLKALRHYSATELLQAGVDLRTVAGRLGHGGGGATTLRVYAAWTSEADRRAAEILGSRVKRPEADGSDGD